MPFTEIVTGRKTEIEQFMAETEMLTDPPPGFVAAVGWETGTEELTVVMVWATPGARGDFAVERAMPVFEAATLRPPSPERIHPTHLYVRDHVASPVAT